MYHLLCSAMSLCPFQLLSPHDQVLKGSLTLPFYGPEKCISFLYYQELYFFMVSRSMSSWFGKQWSHASGCLWAYKLLGERGWRTGLKAACPPITSFLGDPEKCRECVLLNLKGSWKYKPEEVLPAPWLPTTSTGNATGWDGTGNLPLSVGAAPI